MLGEGILWDAEGRKFWDCRKHIVRCLGEEPKVWTEGDQEDGGS